MPTLYIGGTPRQQNEIRARYQWQVGTSATGPWTDIAAGTQKDYTPTPGSQTFYYRRLVLPPSGCGSTPVSISPVAEVVVGANAAPTVTGAVFNTCANTAVNISLSTLLAAQLPIPMHGIMALEHYQFRYRYPCI